MSVIWSPRATLLVLVCAACATRPPPASVAAAPAPVAMATVLALRPVGAGAVTAPVLAALGQASGAAPSARVEVIVRGDDGTMMALVRRPARGLRPGARIAARQGQRL